MGAFMGYRLLERSAQQSRQAARQAETAQVQIVAQVYWANNQTFAASDAALAA